MQAAVHFAPVSEDLIRHARAWTPRVSASRLEASALASVEGRLPDWLRGTLLRTAPAVFEQGPWRAEHWFDGLGMLYSFEFEDSGVRFQQRLMDTEMARQAQTGKMQISSFGSLAHRSLWQRLFSPSPLMPDNANVNVLRMGKQWVAMTESAHQLMVDPSDLRVTGRVRHEDALPRGMLTLAHPHFDFERRHIVNLGLVFGPTTQLLGVTQAAGSARRSEFARIGFKEFPYLHSFGMTRDAVVIINHPFRARASSLLWSNRGFIDHFRWRPELGTELIVLDRTSKGAKPRVFHTDPSFTYHTANTFQDGSDIVIDLLAYRDPSIITEFRVEQMQNGLTAQRPRLLRVRLHANGSTHSEVLSELGFEFPVINYPKVSGRSYRYLWGSTFEGDGKDILALNLDSGNVQRWGIPGMRFGEPVFVARPGSTREDDGVLLSTGSSERESVLAVLAADGLQVHALVRVPVPIPLGFHGSFAARSSTAGETA